MVRFEIALHPQARQLPGALERDWWLFWQYSSSCVEDKERHDGKFGLDWMKPCA